MEAYQELERVLTAWGPHPVVCSSGTAAIHLALEALRLPPRSRIAIPDFTMVACARAAVLADLEPVLVGCDQDGLMDPAALSRVISFVSACMPVHIYGRKCDDAIFRMCNRAAVPIVEDMAELHGLPMDSRSTAACWSFYRNKVVHGEEGGAVCFKQVEHADVAKCLRSLGYTEAYSHKPRGHNYRLSNVHAKLILESFEQLHVEMKRRLSLQDYMDSFCPVYMRRRERLSPWVYDLVRPDSTFGRTKEKVGELLSAGIEARHMFKPMHAQSEFERCMLSKTLYASWLHNRGLYLPMNASMTDEKVELAFRILGS